MQRLAEGLLDTLIVLIGVTTLVFFLLVLVPGDPVDVVLGESAQAADRDAMRAALGLDLPLLERWGMFYADLLRGDLGHSLVRHRPVAALILERLPATLVLAAAAGDTYVEACRLVRKEGFFRVAQDMRQEGLDAFPANYLDDVDEVNEYSTYITSAVSAYERAMGISAVTVSKAVSLCSKLSAIGEIQKQILCETNI